MRHSVKEGLLFHFSGPKNMVQIVLRETIGGKIQTVLIERKVWGRESLLNVGEARCQ